MLDSPARPDWQGFVPQPEPGRTARGADGPATTGAPGPANT